MLLSSGALLLFVMLNYVHDPFGLFSTSKQRVLRIVTNERPSKYLFSMRYVPENFDGILLGPSLSDHIDTSLISAARVYNLSLQGANSAEMRIMAENAMKSGKIRLILICLDPYIIRNRAINDERMQPRLRWSALGSTFMLQYYADLFFVNRLNPEKYSHFGPYGNLHIKESSVKSELAIKKFADFLKGKDFDIPESFFKHSLVDLKEIIDLARSRNVRVAAFYFPMPAEVLSVTSKQYGSFKKAASSLFDDRDLVLDFTADAFQSFRVDYSNYVDQGHLSSKGARHIVEKLDESLIGWRSRWQ